MFEERLVISNPDEYYANAERMCNIMKTRKRNGSRLTHLPNDNWSKTTKVFLCGITLAAAVYSAFLWG